MHNYYELLEVKESASTQEIKKAFRERAKKFHPDISGKSGGEEMRKLLAAYKTLSDRNRRFEYDRAYARFTGKFDSGKFDYRSFLRERNDPESRSKLIFFELLHMEEDEALSIWQTQGGLDFQLENYLDREDWMDCGFILAEELAARGRHYEAFTLLVRVVREERRLPYFKHFMEEVEKFIKELVRLQLRPTVDDETYLKCMGELISLGFSPRYEAGILRSIAETLFRLGEIDSAGKALKEALKRNPGLPNTVKLKQKLHVQGMS
jgi:curved DNA-binding protein CbpA